MIPSTASCVLSRVMQTCAGMSSGTFFSECLYAMRSKNGTIRFRPGSSTLWNLPRRSTTHAFCCGMMRTPSKMNTTTMATRNVAMVARALCVSHAAAIARMTAMMVFQNMRLPPVLFAFLAGRRGGDHQGVAFLRFDVERAARRRALGGAREARVPRRAAILHARNARAFVHPAFEHHGLAAVEEVAPVRRFPAVAHVPGVDQVRAHQRHDARDDCLHDFIAARVGDDGARERAHAEHQKIERPGDELQDSEHEAGDDPPQPGFHDCPPRWRSNV